MVVSRLHTQFTGIKQVELNSDTTKEFASLDLNECNKTVNGVSFYNTAYAGSVRTIYCSSDEALSNVVITIQNEQTIKTVSYNYIPNGTFFKIMYPTTLSVADVSVEAAKDNDYVLAKYDRYKVKHNKVKCKDRITLLAYYDSYLVSSSEKVPIDFDEVYYITEDIQEQEVYDGD